MILLGAMGGLQKGLIQRSQNVMGRALFSFYQGVSEDKGKELVALGKKHGFFAVPEYELEALLSYNGRNHGAIVHGLFEEGLRRPSFLPEGRLQDAFLPYPLAMSLNVFKEDRVRIMAPSHTVSFMEDLPVTGHGRVSAIFSTSVPEIDQRHLWVRLPLIQNMIRERSINRVRFYKRDGSNLSALKRDLFKEKDQGQFLSWEDLNQALVWALNLETAVMTFLFSAMALLVSLCVSSGLMVFFNKVRMDLASFWGPGGLSKGPLESVVLAFSIDLLPFLLVWPSCRTFFSSSLQGLWRGDPPGYFY